MRYKAIIFDLDGTLLDTISDLTNSMNSVLEVYGYQPFTEKDYMMFVGEGADKLVERVLQARSISSSRFDEIKQMYLMKYLITQHDMTKPYEGVMDVIQYGLDHQLHLGVLSNKPHQDTLRVIDYFFPENPFDIVYGKKTGYEPKPDIRALNEMIDIWGLDRSMVLYVGDTYTDMMTAKNGHLDSVGCLWGFRDEVELKAGEAKYIIQHPHEIIEILEG